jgi:hypothetical protein
VLIQVQDTRSHVKIKLNALPRVVPVADRSRHVSAALEVDDLILPPDLAAKPLSNQRKQKARMIAGFSKNKPNYKQRTLLKDEQLAACLYSLTFIFKNKDNKEFIL